MVSLSAAFCFPGQGAQYPRMALDLFEAGAGVRGLFAVASDAAGRDLQALLENADPETLKRSDLSQPAITLANLAAAAYLAEKGVVPVACAGFSLGEYAALVAAGVLTIPDCFRLVSARGTAMQKAADRIAAGDPSAAPGMAAVLGLPPEAVEALLAEWRAAGLADLYAANYNSPKQVVVAGSAAALAAAEPRFKEAGAKRVIRLQVAGPFHSPLVASAADEFAPVLAAVPFGDPVLPLFSNVTGALVRTGAEARALALRQITEPVRWTAVEAALAALAPRAILEVGPGKVLQGLWKDTGFTVPVLAGGTVADAEAAVAALDSNQGES
jgi:[acyl-carrier-protein] S-malonyltransferase